MKLEMEFIMNSKKILKLSNDELALVVGGSAGVKDNLQAVGIGFGLGAAAGPVGLFGGSVIHYNANLIAEYLRKGAYLKNCDGGMVRNAGKGAIAGGATSTAFMLVGAVTVARSLYKKLKSK